MRLVHLSWTDPLSNYILQIVNDAVLKANPNGQTLMYHWLLLTVLFALNFCLNNNLAGPWNLKKVATGKEIKLNLTLLNTHLTHLLFLLVHPAQQVHQLQLVIHTVSERGGRRQESLTDFDWICFPDWYNFQPKTRLSIYNYYSWSFYCVNVYNYVVSFLCQLLFSQVAVTCRHFCCLFFFVL